MLELTASRCLFCDGSRLVSQPALIAPFLRERAGLQQRTTFLDTCADCGGRHFRDRLEESEAARLYDGYRSREYLEQRRRFEPWYTEGLNAGLARDAALRRAAVEAALRDAGLEARGPALDFGGDTGELFPSAVPQAQCSVLDPSGASLERRSVCRESA